jgi:hypothetical protein
MKNINQTLKKMKKFILLFISVLFLTTNINAQDDGFESLLLASKADANKLTEAYMNPAMKGLIYGMSSGWYHTAKVHRTLGFDISIRANASIVPSADEIFNFADLGLSSNFTSNSATSPTVAGTDVTPQATVNTMIQGQSVSATFNMPAGVKDDLPLNAIPTPVVQLSLGLPYKFEASLRLVPKVGSDDVTGELLGIGLKKEITSWFGPLDKLPLHVSLMAAYTSMNVDYAITDSAISGANQEVGFELTSYTFDALASLNFPFINVYGGFGYSTGDSTLKMSGTYNLDYDTGLPAPNDTVTETLTDPLDLAFNASGFKTTLGARVSLGFFKIYADYTLQEYNTVSAGIAFSIR